MFMFWSKRTLIKRLLKARVRGEHETEREAQEDTSSVQQRFPSSVGNETTAVQQQQQQASGGGGGGAAAAAAAAARCIGSSGGGGGRGGEAGGSNLGTGDNKRNGKIASRLHQGWCGGDQSQDDEEEPTRVTRCKELLKTLKENQLEMLVTTVESFGADLGTCVLVPRYKPRESCSADSSCCSRNNCRYGYNNSHHSHNRYHHHHHHLYSHNSGHPRHKHHHTSRCCHRCCCHRCRCPGRENAEQREENRREDGEPSGERERWEQRGGASVEDSSAFGVRNATIDARCDVGGSFREGAAAAAAATATATAMLAAEPYESPPPLLDPHLLSCQVWRWPDLANSSELKRLPVCHSAKDPLYVCFNPYHWSRLCKPESPPPPYCLIADRLRPEDCAPSEGNLSRGRNTTAPLPLPGSLTTNGEGDSEQKEWCTLAYWEQSRRVGPLYPVEPSTVNVFDSLHDGDGLCLSSLAGNHDASLVVQRTRSKIGLGLMLSQEADGVWAYNRSKSPIFVNSPTLDDPESRTLLVYRVQPGFCLNIFDRAKTLPYGCGSTNATTTTTTIPTNTTAYSSSTGFNSGPVDMNSVRISFAKGWGPKYSRQEVTSCPCWLEVLLAPCR